MEKKDIIKDLYEYIKSLDIVDCHEHMPPESQRLTATVDFATLFSHYCLGDLVSVGITSDELATFNTPSNNVEDKWDVFKKYYPFIENTSYAKSAKIAMRHFYGIEELNDSTYISLSEKIKEMNKEGLYNRVLSDCKIKYMLNNRSEDKPAGTYFTPSTDVFKTVTPVPWIPEPSEFNDDSRTFFAGVKSICDIEERVYNFVQGVIGSNAKGIKLFSFEYKRVTRLQAEEALKGLLLGQKDKVLEFYSYMWDIILAEAEKYNIPISVHTGYWGDFRELSPENIIPMIDSHMENRFDLFHIGYPYVEQSLLLGKTRRNVTLNMCWTYVISQKFAYDVLTKIVDFLPISKVMGFGADYYVIEKVYGHREMMCETMSRALGDKVYEGDLTVESAQKWAKAMLWDNPVRAYGLE